MATSYVNSSFSACERIISGVPQGSILGPVPSNILLYDLLFYADDNTLYSCGNNLEEVKQTLRRVKKWLYENYMLLNSGKCHFTCIGKNTENETYFLNNTQMKNRSEEKILGITIDNKLKFKKHVKSLCKKTSQIIWALSRLTNYLKDSEKKLTFNAIIKSQFSYCPLVWMFCSRQIKNLINKSH